MAKNEYTCVEDGIYVCNDCGAYSSSERTVKHHKTCSAGESKRWEKFYDEEKETRTDE